MEIACNKVSIIAAIAANDAIGKDNDLLWRLPNDMKRFKELTVGHTVIMGRKTFESLPKGALPHRRNIVITSNTDIHFRGCEIAHSLNEAIEKCNEEDEIFIIGGASIYEQAFPIVGKIYITRVHATFHDADTFFPKINTKIWQMTDAANFPTDKKHAYPYSFQTYIKKK